MPAYTAQQAIITLVTDNWAHTPVVNSTTFDQIEIPEDGSAFAEITFPFATEDRISFGTPGSNVFRETGAFIFSLRVPVSESLAVWLPRLDTLRAALRGASALSGNLKIDEAPPAIIDPLPERQIYREISIAVPFEHDLFS